MPAQQTLHQSHAEVSHRNAPPQGPVEVGSPSEDPKFVLLRSRFLSPADRQKGAGATPPAAPAVKEAPKELKVAVKRDHKQAFSLLEDVKEFIPKLLKENDLLKQNIFEIKCQAEAEIDAAESQSGEWKLSIEVLKKQIESLEATNLDLRVRLQRSEAVVAIEKELASKVGQDAAEAECLAKLFEDTVIQSFGVGSMFQDALAKAVSDQVRPYAS